MIRVLSTQLSEYLGKLDREEPFSFTRYWDGEMACMVGRTGRNVDSCDYTDALRLALIATIVNNKPYYHAVYFPMWHRGTVNLRRCFAELLIKLGSRVEWHDAMVFQRAFELGAFYAVIKALRKRNCVLVGGSHLRPVTDLLGLKGFIEAPRQNAFEQAGRIKDEIRDAALNVKNPVFLFSAGMATNCVVDDLYGEAGMAKATMVDMGSVWDATLSLRTRIWMRSIPAPTVRRNIYG